MYDKSRSGKAGMAIADAIIEMVHLMYQKNTAQRFMRAMIDRLVERRKEFDEEEE